MSAAKSSHGPVISLMADIAFDPGMAMERQIAVHVRQLIGTEVLKPGVRVPPIRALAEAWDTNYFTVQSALRALVKEGLLVQSPRLGTFVSEKKRSLKRVCLYHGQDLKLQGGSEFGGRLHLLVYRMLAAKGIQTVSYFDHRPMAERSVMPDEIHELIKDRQVDAVIATTHHEAWLDALDLPAASLEKTQASGGVNWDVDSFVRLAMQAIRQAGARRVCVINRVSRGRAAEEADSGRDMKPLLEAEVRKAGAEVVRVPDLDAAARAASMEEQGFLLGEKIVGLESRPDALVIFPDTYTRGLVSALLKHGVAVPAEMLVVSHRNHEMPFFTPFPVTWLTVSIEDYASALLARIEAQIDGRPEVIAALPIMQEGAAAETKGRRASVKARVKAN